MADDRLLQQVASDLAAGLNDDQIRQKHGGRAWTTEDINGAMAIIRLRNYAPTVAAHDAIVEERAPRRRDALSEILLLIVIFGGVPMAYILAKNVGAPLFDRFLTAVVAKQEGIAMPATETAVATSAPASAPVAAAPAAPAKATAAAKPVAKPASAPVQQPVASLPVPSVSFSADNTVVPAGSAITLSWSSTNATSCTGDAFPTSNQTAGSATVKVYGSYDFTLTCKNASHSVSRTVSITVQ
jgi:hypothetical protein